MLCQCAGASQRLASNTMNACKADGAQGLETCKTLCARSSRPLQESTAAGAREREAAAGDHAAARAGLEHQLWLLRDFAERRAEVEAGLRAAQDGVAAERAAGERRAMCGPAPRRPSGGRPCARPVELRGGAGCGRRRACGRARRGHRMQPRARQRRASCACSPRPGEAHDIWCGERLAKGARSEVEREHAGDRERWHREGAARQAAAVAAAAAAAGANTADAVARRALLENELLAAEVAYQSRQARRGRARAARPACRRLLAAIARPPAGLCPIRSTRRAEPCQACSRAPP